jgi:hypothetical protein
MRFDWKFVIGIILAIAGIIVPVILWQFDLNAKSIKVRLVSSTELQSSISASIPDLRLMLNGDIISSPILSQIEIINDGSKPIPASDFETPLEININNNSKIIRSTLISTDPKNLKPVIDFKNQTIQIQPLLLNSGDTIKISILSSGAIPTITANARISGINSIIFDENLRSTNKKYSIILKGVISVIGLILSFSILAIYILSSSTYLSLISFLSFLIISTLSTYGYRELLLLFEIEEKQGVYNYILGFVYFLGAIIFVLTKKSRKEFLLKQNTPAIKNLTTQSPAP